MGVVRDEVYMNLTRTVGTMVIDRYFMTNSGKFILPLLGYRSYYPGAIPSFYGYLH
jgi:hypothetical protein